MNLLGLSVSDLILLIVIGLFVVTVVYSVKHGVALNGIKTLVSKVEYWFARGENTVATSVDRAVDKVKESVPTVEQIKASVNEEITKQVADIKTHISEEIKKHFEQTTVTDTTLPTQASEQDVKAEVKEKPAVNEDPKT